MGDGLRESATDLLLGGRCAGCGVPGGLLCPSCRAVLPSYGVAAWPDPTPPGLVPPWAAGAYADLLRDLVLGHKERGLVGLRWPLGEVLASSVRAALAGAAAAPVVLVPVPTRSSSARQRGRDPLLEVVRSAAGALGPHVRVARLLRSRPGVVDQAGLDTSSRWANLHGSMAVRPRAQVALRRRVTAAHVLICDDVLTTGATAREAQRALEAVGIRALAIATMAATARRTPHRETSAGSLSSRPSPH